MQEKICQRRGRKAASLLQPYYEGNGSTKKLTVEGLIFFFDPLRSLDSWN